VRADYSECVGHGFSKGMCGRGNKEGQVIVDGTGKCAPSKSAARPSKCLQQVITGSAAGVFECTRIAVAMGRNR